MKQAKLIVARRMDAFYRLAFLVRKLETLHKSFEDGHAGLVELMV